MKSLPLVLVFVAVASAKGGGPEVYKRQDMLIGPLALAEPEHRERQFVILDCRPEKEYDEGHVPRARRVDHDEWAKAFGDGKDADEWGKRIGGAGHRQRLRRSSSTTTRRRRRRLASGGS